MLGHEEGAVRETSGSRTPSLCLRGCLMGEVVVVARIGGLLVLEEVDWCPCRHRGTVRPAAPLTSARSACPWARGAGNPVRWA